MHTQFLFPLNVISDPLISEFLAYFPHSSLASAKYCTYSVVLLVHVSIICLSNWWSLLICIVPGNSDFYHISICMVLGKLELILWSLKIVFDNIFILIILCPERLAINGKRSFLPDFIKLHQIDKPVNCLKKLIKTGSHKNDNMSFQYLSFNLKLVTHVYSPISEEELRSVFWVEIHLHSVWLVLHKPHLLCVIYTTHFRGSKNLKAFAK